MMHLAYLLGLLIGITGLLVIDRRFGLAFWFDARRTWRTLVPTILVFIMWDALGIGFKIFYHDDSAFSLPFTIAPEFPLEEIVFLFLMAYSALILYRVGGKVWPRI